MCECLPSEKRRIKTHYICKCNSLSVKCPNLIKEWDYEKNIIDPYDITIGSHKKVWWICINKHSWNAVIKSRALLGNTCPYCTRQKVCDDNNLLVLYPLIAEEYDELNEFKASEVTPGSKKIVKWRCKINSEHIWEASIKSRTGQQSGCPFCCGQKTCKSNCVSTLRPDLVEEWDDSNELSPDNVTIGSKKEILWKCKNNHKWISQVRIRVKIKKACPECYPRKKIKKNIPKEKCLKYTHPYLADQWDEENKILLSEVTAGSEHIVSWICPVDINHKYNARISERTHKNKPTNCPYCSGHKVCHSNSLEYLFPKLVEQWDKENNILPSEVTIGSDKIVSWICPVDADHKYNARISDRTRKDRATNCPYCSNRKICYSNNLATTHPDIAIEWDESNTIKPTQVTKGSEIDILWTCKVDKSHKWWSKVCNRVVSRGCPVCNNTSGFSISAKEWIKSLEIEQGISIQHAKISQSEEYMLPELGIRVDGYNHETKTVYEYHGDYWHGNPMVFSAHHYNKKSKKTYWQLYQDTLEREERIRQAGYKLIIKWDTPFDSNNIRWVDYEGVGQLFG